MTRFLPAAARHSPSPVKPDETGDAALGGAVRLIQPRKGYRFSLDAVLLARFASERRVESALDLGCGCGVVGLCLLALQGASQVAGIDLQPEAVDRARRSAEWNGWTDRTDFRLGDLRRIRELYPAGSFPLVVSNPPYRPACSGRVSPDAGVAAARHEVAGTLTDVVSAAAWLLASGGQACLVYPASRLAALLSACRGAGLEPKVLRLAHPRPEAPASLALLRATKGAGEGLEIRPPLILHGSGVRYSAEAEALLGPPGTPAPARPGS